MNKARKSPSHSFGKIIVFLGIVAWLISISACQVSGFEPTGISETNFSVQPETAESTPSLFSVSSKEITSPPSQDPTVIRLRFVDIYLKYLDESEVGDEIILNLFNDVIYTAVLDKKVPNLPQGYTWGGHLDGIDHSQVILVVSGDQVAGNIALPGAFYQIRYISDGIHAVSQIDQSAFPQEAEPVEPGE